MEALSTPQTSQLDLGTTWRRGEGREGKAKLVKGMIGDLPQKGWAGSAITEI